MLVRLNLISENYEDFLRAKQKVGDLSHSSQRVEQLVSESSIEVSQSKDDRLQSHTDRKQQQRQQQRREKDVAKLESGIEKLETELAEIEMQMADPQLYQNQDKWRLISKSHQQVKERLEETYARWEILQESE